MKILKPFYYDDFKCIGGQCIDNCCRNNWRIDIDEKAYKKYRKIKGQMGKKINNNISRNRSNPNYLQYGKINLKNNKCSLLSEDGLCTIHGSLGEDYLCNTCRVYPREIRKYGEIYERNLSISCPEVARYIIKCKDNFSFDLEDEKLSDLDKDYIVDSKYNEKLLNILWDTRSLAMEIIQFKEIEIWKRISFFKMLTDKVQNIINEKQYDNYEEVLNNFREQATNINVINSLDKISLISDVKFKFIQSALQVRANQGTNNEKFDNLLKEYNELFDKNIDFKNNVENIIKIEEEFNLYLKEQENIIENLLIYLIYKYFMKALHTKDLNAEVNNIILSYAMIKMLLLSRYNKNDKKLNEDDFVEVFYIFSRTVEHNIVFLPNIYKDIKEAGYDTLAYMTILVR